MADVDPIALARLRRRIKSGAARDIRQNAGLSLAEVADPTKVSPSTVLRWERGECMPHGEKAERYAGILDDLVRD
jgi:transcriptional regulator with XRE-family HTH domain